MSGLFSSPKLPPVPPPEPKPEIAAADQASIDQKERDRQRASSGRRSTMLTGGLGIQSDPLIKRSTLGGR